MNWTILLRDQLPFLLVLCPLIGSVTVLIALRIGRDLARPLSISNWICSVLILGSAVANHYWDVAHFQEQLHAVKRDSAQQDVPRSALEAVWTQSERQRVEKSSRHPLILDGLNLWPVLFLVAVAGIVIWSSGSFERPPGFLSGVLLLESVCLAQLMACDVRGLLIAMAAGAVAMTWLIGIGGGKDRRSLSSRFLFRQAAALSLVMLGLAMLVVGVPWLMLEDSPKFPTISYHLVRLIDEIHRWTGRNELSLRYETQVFPWMLTLLSAGFALQFGLFPFHSVQLDVMSQASDEVRLLYLAGTVSAAGISWFRWALALAPDVMAGFDYLLLIPVFGNVWWGLLLAWSVTDRQRRMALLLMSLLGLAFVGNYCFSPTGMSASWLMFQQTLIVGCGLILLPVQQAATSLSRADPNPGVWRGVVLQCLAAVGLFASGTMIVTELIRESLLLSALFVGAAAAIVAAVLRWMTPTALGDRQGMGSRYGFVSLLWLAMIVNLWPAAMLFPVELDFARMFRPFERSSSQ